jgi:hypothetical protein
MQEVYDLEAMRPTAGLWHLRRSHAAGGSIVAG